MKYLICLLGAMESVNLLQRFIPASFNIGGNVWLCVGAGICVLFCVKFSH